MGASGEESTLMARHAQIYPTEQELKLMQELVNVCELTLRVVSDRVALEDEAAAVAEEAEEDGRSKEGEGEKDADATDKSGGSGGIMNAEEEPTEKSGGIKKAEEGSTEKSGGSGGIKNAEEGYTEKSGGGGGIKKAEDEPTEKTGGSGGTKKAEEESTEKSDGIKKVEGESIEKSGGSGGVSVATATAGGTVERPGANVQLVRRLKAVVRVGAVAKGLLLHGGRDVHLVLLLTCLPTETLLAHICELIQAELKTVPLPFDSDSRYEAELATDRAAIRVRGSSTPPFVCTISVTSPVVRDACAAPPSDKDAPLGDSTSLDRRFCMHALAEVRHAKWFEVKAAIWPPCLVVARLLRDMCQRVPSWGRLSEWSVELLTEMCVSSAGRPDLTPGGLLRRVLEALASGLLLTAGPAAGLVGRGLHDPCEREPVDATAEAAHDPAGHRGSLTRQEREDVTVSAQHLLRQLALGGERGLAAVVDLQEEEKEDAVQDSLSPQKTEALKRPAASSADDSDTSNCKQPRTAQSVS